MGKLAWWADCSGEVARQRVGFRITHHPENPPASLFCRDDGTMVSNLTRHEPRETRDGESLIQRWRVLIHDGDATDVDHEAAYYAWDGP